MQRVKGLSLTLSLPGTKMMDKPIHVKPSYYAYCFYDLKSIAIRYGYNLVIHGSMSTDLDLIAIPWTDPLGDVDSLIEEIATTIGGLVMDQSESQMSCFPHGRRSYVINLNRSGVYNNYEDAKFYLDISVIPAP